MLRRAGKHAVFVASSVALALGGVVAAGASQASAGPRPSAQPLGAVAKATKLPSAGNAVLVGTSHLQQFPSSSSTGSTALPSQLPSSEHPYTPDVGGDASSNAPVPASLSHSQGRSHPSKGGGTLPVVSPNPVSGPTAGLTSVAGLNAFNQGATHPVNNALPGVDIEPPDQGLCSNGTYTLEVNNMVAQVFAGGPGGTPGPAYPLESLFDTPQVFGNGNDGSYSVQGDPRCAYDAGTGHWFASQLWLDLNDATSFGWAGTFIAVSQTSDPNGTWNVYFVPDADNALGVFTCNNQPATSPTANPCFGDQPLLGLDANSVQISTNEYSVAGATPNGQANLYFLSKSKLVSGASSIPVWWDSVGGNVAAPGVGPWYSLTPAQTPDGAYNPANNGTSYALSSLDFSGTGDNRIAEWAYTNTNAVNKGGAINIYEDTLSSGAYAMPPLAAQKVGPTPLGDNWSRLNGSKSNKQLPEGPIQTNDDRMTAVAVDPSTGALVGALNTAVDQTSNGNTLNEYAGVAYFVVQPSLSSSGLSAGPVTTGYISPAGANAAFPGVAVASTGNGVVTYTLTGSGYYPSTAYSLVGSGDSLDSTVHVAMAGAGPQDGFTEYQFAGTTSYRPRWGDYSTAVVVPTGMGSDAGTVQFATEMITQSCTDQQFQADFTCGGTRDLFANWGTSVNQLTP